MLLPKIVLLPIFEEPVNNALKINVPWFEFCKYWFEKDKLPGNSFG